ncbi:signal peptidase [Paraburkholderia sp. BR10936]|uniref:signal peptidase n=1 Tax=Paraburkholderia sp. BR10936 TaxID=3236993 RepID=UPI0034D204A0
MKKTYLTLSMAAIVSLTLAACGSQRLTLPIQPAASLSTAKAASSADPATKIAVYFGAQPHPEVVRHVGDASHSLRAARATDGAEASCNKVLAMALDKLRADAHNKGANAVINVTTRFHGSETGSATEYTCGVSQSAAAIAVTGDLVVLQAN